LYVCPFVRPVTVTKFVVPGTTVNGVEIPSLS
jgi:hypothetical protein